MKTVDKQAGAISLVDELNKQGCRIADSDLELECEGGIEAAALGSGGSGTVVKGLWQGTTEVAVKILHGGDSESLNDMYTEMNVLSKLRHPNIVTFYGYSHIDGSMCLVTEYVSGGDLSKYIFDRSVDISFDHILVLAKSICAGMVYLHSQDVIHRDLKPGNILVTNWSAGSVKICDFGLSKALKRGEVLADDVFSTPAYSAPELNFSQHTKSVDVYSFAIILWEMAARKTAWEKFTTLFELSIAVENGERPEMPLVAAGIEEWYSELIEKCWSQAPLERPSFREIFDILRTKK